MAVIINGTSGITNVNGSASTPAETGLTTNTGIYYGTNTVGLATNGTSALFIDSSQNVGIGTSSPSTYANSYAPVLVTGTGNNWATIQGRADGPSGAGNGVSYGVSYSTNPINGARIFVASSGSAGQQGQILFFTKNTDDNTNQPTERMRIDSSGRLLLNSTTYAFNSSQIMNVGAGVIGVEGSASTSVYSLYIQNASGIGAASPLIRFSNSNGVAGSISSTGGTTTYATSSDYRLKENIAPMTGALGVVAQLNPVTYTWKADGSDGQGFIAHELQAVVPDAVVGEKDAVDENGNIKPQGIDTSFLVATLTAAIKEQQALITQLQADVAILKGQA